MYCERPVVRRKKPAGNPGGKTLEEMSKEILPNGMRRLETGHFDHSASLDLNPGRPKTGDLKGSRDASPV
jgi:hypothetical protein